MESGVHNGDALVKWMNWTMRPKTRFVLVFKISRRLDQS